MIVLRILKKCLLTNNNGDMTIDTEFNVGDSVCTGLNTKCGMNEM